MALDLMGGDHAPDAVVDGALLATDERPDIEVILVGPEDVAVAALAARGAAGRLAVVPASQIVDMTEDAARAVRAKRDASIRVAAGLVRDGAADAFASAGSTGATMAAALFTLGRLPGVTRPALAVVIPAAGGPLVLLDAGANPDCSPDSLAQFALAGSAYATARLGIPEPRVGLLTIGEEPGKGDELRRAAYGVLADLPVRFVGGVEGGDVVTGGKADVVVTDGFTGNVLLKGLEAAMPLAGAADTESGAMLLGVDGVVVVAHGASSARAIASAVTLAAQVARDGLVPRIAGALAALVARRRTQAGLAAQP